MKVTTVGIDLAKSVFQVHGVNERGKAALCEQLKRSEVLKFFANLPPCLIGLEACASAYHWARKLIALGDEVKLVAPQFVKPYVKTNKNDCISRLAFLSTGSWSSASSTFMRYPFAIRMLPNCYRRALQMQSFSYLFGFFPLE